jgi:hypothetical protein
MMHVNRRFNENRGRNQLQQPTKHSAGIDLLHVRTCIIDTSDTSDDLDSSDRFDEPLGFDNLNRFGVS